MRRAFAFLLTVAFATPTMPSGAMPSPGPVSYPATATLADPALAFFHSGYGRWGRVAVIAMLGVALAAAQAPAKFIEGTDDLAKLSAGDNAAKALVNRVLADAHGTEAFVAATPGLRALLEQAKITDPTARTKAADVFILERALLLGGLRINERAEGLESYLEQFSPELNPKNPFNWKLLAELRISADKRHEFFGTFLKRIHDDLQKPAGDFHERFVSRVLQSGMDPLMLYSIVLAASRQLGIPGDLVMDEKSHALYVRVTLGGSHTLYIDAAGLHGSGVQAVTPTTDGVLHYLHGTIASAIVPSYLTDLKYFMDAANFSPALLSDMAPVLGLPLDQQDALQRLVDYARPLPPQREDGNILGRRIHAHLQRGPVTPETVFQHVAELQAELADQQREIEGLLNDASVRVLEVDFDQSPASRALQERYGSLFATLRKISATLGDWSRNPLKIETDFANRLPKGKARNVLEKDINEKLHPKKAGRLAPAALWARRMA